MIPRIINASRDIETKMLLKGQNEIRIYSFFPIDRAGCACKTAIKEWKDSISLMPPHLREGEINKHGFIECPQDKTKMNRYKITCGGCGMVQGYCWASDETLKDWCDFHYVQWTDGKQWYGCFTPQVSPIDETLCLECACGVDTRDIRANMTLPGKTAFEMEEKNKIGRGFGTEQSKFEVEKVRANVSITFNKPSYINGGQ